MESKAPAPILQRAARSRLRWLAVLNRKVIRTFYRKNPVLAMLLVFWGSFLVQIAIGLAVPEKLLFHVSDGPMARTNLDAWGWLSVGLGAPLFETAVSFSLVYFLFRKFSQLRSIVPFAIVGTVLFAALHWYSLSYILSVAGISYFWFVYYAILKRQKRRAFLTIVAIHSLRNLLALTAATFWN